MRRPGSYKPAGRTGTRDQNLLRFLIPVILILFPFSSSGQYELILEDWPAQRQDTLTRDNRDTLLFSLNIEYLNAVNDNKSPYELIPIIEKILEIDTSQYNLWFDLGLEHIKIHQFLHAMDALNRGLRMFPSDHSHSLVPIYISLSFCYHRVGRHQKEREILERASMIDPDNAGIIGRYAVCAHSRLRHTEAVYYKGQLISVLREEGVSESDIAFHMGKLFMTTDYLEAEKYLRTAREYDPENVDKMAALAWVLIRNALKINEGMELINKAIEADPENALFIHQQGYGHYLLGHHEEALQNLRRARELYQGYSYELENHIGLVEEALASREQ
ncbi:MAG TPA: tetratricopeptide repeat protein [Bacteroides sp.]|nr:tetratricopeptide repeat protein [Bacteroides sp.]